MTLLNLGPQSRAWLAEVGIDHLAQLQTQDAVLIFLAIKARQPKTSMNLLYALVGAQQGVHWQEVARHQKMELLMRLAAHKELQSLP
jgi:DNA transformation protein